MWSVLTHSTNILPVNISMNDFSRYRESNRDWYSDSFYTHLHGYRMRLRVDANGAGKHAGTHVSVYVYVMRGDFDDKLQWPLRTTLQIEVLRPSGVGEQHRMIFSFNENTPAEAAQQITSWGSGEASQGWGIPAYLAHKRLGGFLVKDTLTFQVSLVDLKSSQ